MPFLLMTWRCMEPCYQQQWYSSSFTGIIRLHTWTVNTLRPRQHVHHFADDVFQHIFLNENVWISIEFSLKFVSKGPINNTPALVQIMAWRWPGDKPLSEPMVVSLLTHICVTRSQWVLINWITHTFISLRSPNKVVDAESLTYIFASVGQARVTPWTIQNNWCCALIYIRFIYVCITYL